MIVRLSKTRAIKSEAVSEIKIELSAGDAGGSYYNLILCGTNAPGGFSIIDGLRAEDAVDLIENLGFAAALTDDGELELVDRDPRTVTLLRAAMLQEIATRITSGVYVVPEQALGEERHAWNLLADALESFWRKEIEKALLAVGFNPKRFNFEDHLRPANEDGGADGE